MIGKLKEMNRALRQYDSCLYAQESHVGRLDIYRKAKYADHPPHFLFALTDSWRPEGRPRDYGIDVVLNRIKAHDLWRDDTFVERWIKQNEKEEESQSRALRNSIESFLYDFRGQFQKATNEINTGNLNKLYRKEGSHAFSQSR